MSTHEQITNNPTSAVRNTGGRNGPQGMEEPMSDEVLREMCDKNYHQLLPLIAEKMQKEKEQKDRLNAVKARLIYGEESGVKIRNHEESHYSESKTPTARYCKRKICDGHYTTAVRVLSSYGVAPYNDATLEDLKTKHPFKPPPSLPHISIDHHYLVASPAVVLDRIKSFPHGTSCGRDGLHAQHLMDYLSGVVVALSDELVSSITQVVNLFLDGKCPQHVG
ncbi:hypothetical protein Tco_0733533, partial [Tanacetum coccineum]